MSGAQGLMLAVEFLKTLGKLVIYAAVAAAVLTGLAVLAGLTGWVPAVRIVWIDFTMPPWLATWLALFINLLAISFIYKFLGGYISGAYESGVELYSQLPAAGKALIAGIPFAIVAGLVVTVTHLLAYPLSTAVRVVVPLLAWLVVSIGSFVHLQAADELGVFLTRLSIGIAVGFGFAALPILFDRFVDAVSLPGYVPLIVWMVTAPPAGIVLVRSTQREGGGFLSALLVKTGFAQTRRIQAVTVAVALGLLVAILTALLVSAVIESLPVTLVLFMFSWVVTIVVAIKWFQRTDVAYGDLVIVGVQDRSSGNRRELAVRNQRDERVDLRDAKIRDTEYDLYRTNIDVLLGPGQTETFDIPPNFSLFPSTDSKASDLPMGLSVRQSADAPVIVTREGEKFKLRWAEGVAEAAGYSEVGQGTRTRDADGREDRV
jgi:hypothetical protein